METNIWGSDQDNVILNTGHAIFWHKGADEMAITMSMDDHLKDSPLVILWGISTSQAIMR